METVILQSKPRKSSRGTTFSISVIGNGDLKDEVRQSIQDLEHHPAKVARRSMLDMLALIDEHRLNIRYTEHYFDEDGLENWLFVLQS